MVREKILARVLVFMVTFAVLYAGAAALGLLS
jgi:hypothetical protein